MAPTTDPDDARESASAEKTEDFDFQEFVASWWPEDDGEKIRYGYLYAKLGVVALVSFMVEAWIGLATLVRIECWILFLVAGGLSVAYFVRSQVCTAMIRVAAILAAISVASLMVASSQSETDTATISEQETEEPRDDPVPETLAPTLRYWQGLIDSRNRLAVVREMFLSDDSDDSQTLEQVAAIVARTRESVESTKVMAARLPVNGVEPDVLELGVSLNELIGDSTVLLTDVEIWVSHMNRAQTNSTSTATLVESFIRGAMMDPFGKSNEIKAEFRELQDDAEQIEQSFLELNRKENDWAVRAGRLRGKLAQKYGIEFPPIE